MCGIVGLFLKNPSLRPALGVHFTPMLNGMSERGPDSAGIAIYHDETEDDTCKVTVFHPDDAFPWLEVGDELGGALTTEVRVETQANHAVFHVGADAGAVCDWLNATRPDIRIMGYGHSLEIFKDKGTPQEITARYGVERMEGTHAIGHTRMATESAVTTEHSHPFIADVDACLVHNGSLSNHNRLRGWLSRRGMRFESDNDTEVAARYFAYRLNQGASLKEAMEAGLTDLDGFFTFAMGTRDGFAVLRDGFACKPAVLAETDDWVAMASEFRSLADLPGVDGAHIWEPEPEIVYSWDLGSRT
jgi:amidophosphoribosyltransferase